MVEAAVEADDDCMMRYLEGETISDEEIMRNRGELQPEVTGEISNRSKRRIRKNKIA